MSAFTAALLAMVFTMDGVSAEEETVSTEDASTVRGMLAQARTALGAVRDATYTLHKSEWKGGSQLAAQVIAIRYRAPGDLYLRWEDSTNAGMQAIWRSGSNAGKLLVNPGRFLPTLSLDPQGSVAMNKQRHPIWMASVAATLQLIVDEDARMAKNGLPVTYRDLGTQVVWGTSSHCYQADMPKDRDPTVYALKVEVCLGLPTWMPSRFVAWNQEDGALRKVEDYGFEGLRVNVGLGDSDFDPARFGF